MKTTAPFIAASMVRSDATFESLSIFRNEMEKYRNGISDEDMQFTKNAMLRSNALRYETNNALTEMLATIAK
jgi:zinc protease